jgi:pimeloyl-ACP methyl ester carboxylesterase
MKTLWFGALVCFALSASAAEYYVKVPFEGLESLKKLTEQGFDVGGVNFEKKRVTLIVKEEQLAKTYLGTAFMGAMRGVCEGWPRGPVDPDFGAPLQSSVPTLILSGSNDPVTPERYGTQIVKRLSKGTHVIAAGQGHGQLATGCIWELTADFIAAASTAGLDEDCVRSIRPTPFMLSRSATAP